MRIYGVGSKNKYTICCLKVLEAIKTFFLFFHLVKCTLVLHECNQTTDLFCIYCMNQGWTFLTIWCTRMFINEWVFTSAKIKTVIWFKIGLIFIMLIDITIMMVIMTNILSRFSKKTNPISNSTRAGGWWWCLFLKLRFRKYCCQLQLEWLLRYDKDGDNDFLFK